jgi:hypothetical protein
MNISVAQQSAYSLDILLSHWNQPFSLCCVIKLKCTTPPFLTPKTSRSILRMAMRWLRLSGKLTFLLKGKKGKQSGSLKKKKNSSFKENERAVSNGNKPEVRFLLFVSGKTDELERSMNRNKNEILVENKRRKMRVLLWFSSGMRNTEITSRML